MSELAKVTRHAANRGMITVRGDMTHRKFKRAIKAATGLRPPAAGKFVGTGQTGVVWMSPDELLVMVPYHEVNGTMSAIDTALAGQHYLAADVSDARAVFTLAGPRPREVLARLCPVDLHVDRFGEGDARRTRIAQVAAAFWCHGSGFDVVCFRSVGDYMDGLLRNASKASPTGALGT